MAGTWPAARGEAKAAADLFLADRAVTALDGKGATREGMQDVLRIASVVHAAAAIVEGEAALQESALAAA